jgi:cell wall-associated NlpC family hydrolase
MSDEVKLVLERALSQLGVVYAWGGGDAQGPTKGIRDGGVADSFGDYDKTGFDCSGLMIYAFAGAGKELAHYSGYQAEAGPRVPLAERRPGDLLFWADDAGAGPVHHVALYLGDDQMVEAPESGKAVRIAPVRFTDELLPTVTRLV